jgi:hypothetical protein
MRCKRTICDKECTDREVEEAWLVVNRRLSGDKTTVTKVLEKEPYKHRQIHMGPGPMGQSPSRALYKRHRDLPEDWIYQNVVFG